MADLRRYTPAMKREREQYARTYKNGATMYDNKVQRRERAQQRTARREEYARQVDEFHRSGERYFASNEQRLRAAERNSTQSAYGHNRHAPTDPAPTSIGRTRTVDPFALLKKQLTIQLKTGMPSFSDVRIEYTVDIFIDHCRTRFADYTIEQISQVAAHLLTLWINEEQQEEAARREQTRAETSTPKLSSAYAMLGLKPGATEGEIKAAYRKLVKKLHPDQHPPDLSAKEKAQRTEQFIQVQAAYDELCP